MLIFLCLFFQKPLVPPICTTLIVTFRSKESIINANICFGYFIFSQARENEDEKELWFYSKTFSNVVFVTHQVSKFSFLWFSFNILFNFFPETLLWTTHNNLYKNKGYFCEVIWRKLFFLYILVLSTELSLACKTLRSEVFDIDAAYWEASQYTLLARHWHISKKRFRFISENYLQICLHGFNLKGDQPVGS